ncbi:hypothetical protein FHR99_002689 [Litorivivens lipolytica]|uniref:Pyridoxal phosphate homeostasis protein n=1 Tax=Litorivivens lipolytica TaxID=1524264 RepID=A0A7W4W6P1_9GAMM|nr:YggS family pyridoxal phosphate-dependent enzyme [Litorivivens lipolytica]MBB3048415.1 hypothetical protein [Litorivivens lipolytica]
MIDEASIKGNIAELLERIRTCAQESGRSPHSVKLMAVSKTRPASAIRAALAGGLSDIGENYIQEARAKQEELSSEAICWHCIGPIQSNKSRTVAEHFDWVHTVDRLKLAKRLSQQRPPELPPLNICLQVNIDREPQKAGVAPEQLAELAEAVSSLPNLRLRGLMAIPAARSELAEQRAVFAEVRQCFEQLAKQHTYMDTLSMGMSRDFPAAIAEGATIVRIGTEIFGARD